MARPIRIEFAGAFYHVTSRGNARQSIYREDGDYRLFLQTLADVVSRYRWIVHAYCLMGNHYHLLVETPEPNLSQGMRQLNGVFTQKCNRRYNTTGHLFQGRFKAFIVEKEPYLLALVRYILLNPVRAGMVSSPQDWPWSSFRSTIGLEAPEPFMNFDFITGMFSQNASEARSLFVAFVNRGSDAASPLKASKGGFILGSETFVENFRGQLAEHPNRIESVRREKHAARPSLPEIFDGKSRNDAIQDAVLKWGYTLVDVSAYVGLHYSSVSRLASKTGEPNNAKNKDLTPLLFMSLRQSSMPYGSGLHARKSRMPRRMTATGNTVRMPGIFPSFGITG